MQYPEKSIKCHHCRKTMTDTTEEGVKYCSDKCRAQVVAKVHRRWKSKLKEKNNDN